MSVRVGVATIVRYGDCLLMGLRKGSHGAGTWSFPGGHLEEGESVVECAARELREETCIFIHHFNFTPTFYTNDIFVNDGKHYVTLYTEVYLGGSVRPEPKVIEPEKCERWEWFDDYHRPEPLFLPVENLLRAGLNPWKRLPL